MNKFLILLGGLFALMFAGCNSDGREDDLIDTLEKEKIAIHQYLSTISSPILYIEYYSIHGQLIDTLYIFNYDNSGEVAKDTGWVLMDYEKYFLQGDKLDTTDPQIADSLIPVTYAYGGPIFYRLDTVKKYDYVAEALRHISVGEMGGEMIVPSILAGGNYGNPLHYKLFSRKIVMNVKENEEKVIQEYLNPLGALETFEDYPNTDLVSDTTTYTALVEKGTGDRKIQTGDSVLLEFSTALLREKGGRQFEIGRFARDSVKILFNDTWQKRNTLGLVKGMQRLQEGDSAHIVVPYGMAYGGVGTTRDITVNGTKQKQYLIPPLTTLLYEIRIRKVVAPKTEE